MCPRGRHRGQGRPRGLHLCLIVPNKYRQRIALWEILKLEEGHLHIA